MFYSISCNILKVAPRVALQIYPSQTHCKLAILTVHLPGSCKGQGFLNKIHKEMKKAYGFLWGEIMGVLLQDLQPHAQNI